MSARKKLNSAFIVGNLIVATLVGIVFQSMAAFAVAAVVLIGLSLADGSIRPGRR